MSYVIKNDELILCFSGLGAELTSISDTKTGRNYLWNADPTYWKRSSPVLFPIVGSLKDKSFTYKGITYPLSQHGFARDLDFKVIDSKENSISFLLESNKDTLEIYPFPFRLIIAYTLVQREITVTWEVVNTGADTMYFSIGAHPAFLCPLNANEKQSDYFLAFDCENPIGVTKINENGLALKGLKDSPVILETENGLLPVSSHLFDDDALVIENNQFHKVSLLTPNKIPYVTVSFDAPLFGLWSPAGKNAPFVCIEPWYGRCDSEDFNGTLEDREYGNKLEAGKNFQTSYTISIASDNIL